MTGVGLLALRLALSFVFGFAAAAKLANRPRLSETLQAFAVPRRFVAALAVAVPASELVVAALLLPSSTARAGALAAAGLVAVFTAATVVTLARGERPGCSCFGAIGAKPIGPRTVARNGVLAGAAIGVAVLGAGRSVSSIHLAPAWVAIVTLAAAVALLSAFAWQLLRQSGRMLERLQALEEGVVPSPRPALAVGHDAPPIESVELGGAPVVLVFSEPTCGACTALAPRLARLSHGPHRVAVVSGEPEASKLYGVDTVPSAVLVDDLGRIATPLAVGLIEVERLLDEIPVESRLRVASI